MADNQLESAIENLMVKLNVSGSDWYVVMSKQVSCVVVIDIVSLDVASFFFFNDTATTEIYTLSLHDALPICYY